MTYTATKPTQAATLQALTDDITIFSSAVEVETFLTAHIDKDNAHCPPYVGAELQFVKGEDEPEYYEVYVVMVNRFPTQVECTQHKRIANWAMNQGFQGLFSEWRTLPVLATIRYENSQSVQQWEDEFYGTEYESL